MASISKKDRLRTVGVNLILFAVLYGLVEFNKDVIRPLVRGEGIESILTGCFPNFISAYMISLFFVNPCSG